MNIFTKENKTTSLFYMDIFQWERNMCLGRYDEKVEKKNTTKNEHFHISWLFLDKTNKILHKQLTLNWKNSYFQSATISLKTIFEDVCHCMPSSGYNKIRTCWWLNDVWKCFATNRRICNKVHVHWSFCASQWKRNSTTIFFL